MEESILRKVIALLDKAEATPFPEEAEAFTAKAQALIARHGIEAAVTEARTGQRATEEVTTITIRIQAPYVRPKASIIAAVGQANRCKNILMGDDRLLLIGFPSDLEMVEVLSASLLIQATRAMAKASANVRSDRVKSFKNAFLLGFANEVGRRLVEAAQNAQADVEQETGTSVALVLRDRQSDVDAFLRREFPNTRTVRSKASNGAGFRGGTHAGARADIGNKRVAGARGALGR